MLNQPQQLLSVTEGAQISFVAPDGGEHPIRVSAKYLAERGSWIVEPCAACGLTELFDAPSDLIGVAFPSLPAGAIVEAFTATCGLCGGVQFVRQENPPTGDPRA